MDMPPPAPPWTSPGPSEAIDTVLAVSRHSLRARLYQTGRRLFWGAAPFILASAVFPGQVWLALAAMVMALSALAMVAGAAVGMTPSPWRVLATLDDHGLRLAMPTTVIALPREALRDGMVIAPSGALALRLHDRAGDRYDLAMPDEPTAWRWLHALGLSADRRAVRVVSNRVLLQAVVGYFASSFTALPLMLAWMLILSLIGRREEFFMMPLASMHSAMFGVWLMSWLVGRVDITVGGDGLRVGTSPWRRYVPFDALEGVSRVGSEGLALRVRGRWRPLKLRFASSVEAEAVAVRIAAARAAWEVSTPPACIARLAVGDPEDAEAWRAAFRDAVGDGSYRDMALTLADLEAVVISVTVTPAQRMGAVLALRDLQPAKERSGVRVAAELLVGAEALDSIARADADLPSGARLSRER